LPRGKHPLQLYSTPNGVKVTVMLEEWLASGHGGAEYDAWLIRIGEGNQFGRGFVGVNPNSKIRRSWTIARRHTATRVRIRAILLYLAGKSAPSYQRIAASALSAELAVLADGFNAYAGGGSGISPPLMHRKRRHSGHGGRSASGP
jgi:GST-like protein